LKRAALVASLVLVAGFAGDVNGQAAAPKKQKVLVGFHDNRTVRYFDFGRIMLRAGNKLAPIWIFANGVEGQLSIFDSVPGNKRYSALRRVNTVTWAVDATPHLLRSAAAVRAAQASGDVTVKTGSRVINAPLLGFGQKRHAGFAKGKVIHYYELGLVKVAPGNEILPIWTFKNGVNGQSNIADVVPGTTAYPPLWSVIQVTWRAGAQRTLVRSFEQLQAARKAGKVTLQKLPMVVNCPFV
jgi:hypothetical protein